METRVINFEATGRVEAMHSDDFDLSFLGRRSVHRASDIKFDSSGDCWDIFMNDGTGAFTVTAPDIANFDTYENARKFEVKWLNECRLRQVGPTSWYGLHVLAGHLRNEGRLLTSPAS